MKNDIVYYHKQLQKCIRLVEQDENNQEALKQVKDLFLTVFDMIKMIMISRQERYYGVFLMNFDLCIDFSSYSDAGVNIDSFPFRMIVNPLLIGRRSLSEIIYILCHEIEHIVLNHPVASIQYNLQKDPFVSFKLNLAMDASINDRLSLDSKAHQFDIISQPKDAITSDYLHESFQIHIKELQAFDYYFKRIPDPALDEKAFPKFVVCGRTRTNEIVTEEKRKNAIVLPSWGGKTDLGETSSLLRKFVADVCNEMPDSMRSNLPKHQKETLNKLLTPPSIPWGYVLKRFIGTIPDGHRKTRARLNRRQPLRYDISGSINNRIIKLVVAIDTSGSMDKKALEQIMAEIFSIVGARKCVVTIIECDTTIQRIYQVKREQDISYDVQGRGGTSYIPVIEYLNQNRYFRDAILIYFTDGEGDCSIPRPLTAKVLWVLQDEDCVLSVRNPYGEIAVMNQKST